MADVNALKKVRAAKKIAFEAKMTNLKGLLDAKAAVEGTQGSFNSLVEAFDGLVVAHSEYAVEVDENTLKQEGDFMLMPQQKMKEIQVDFFKDKAAQQKAADSAAATAEFESEKKLKNEAEKARKKPVDRVNKLVSEKTCNAHGDEAIIDELLKVIPSSSPMKLNISSIRMTPVTQ